MISVNIPSALEQEGHYFYNIEVSVGDVSNPDTYRVSRRYSDFEHLRQALEVQTKRAVPYNLPSKLSSFVKTNGKVVAERRKGLAFFVDRLLNDPQYRRSSTVLAFFNLPQGVFLELDYDDMEKRRSSVGKIESPTRWLEVLRDVNVQLERVRQDVSDGESVLKSKLKLRKCRTSLDTLKSYNLASSGTLGAGERARRTKLLQAAQRCCEELGQIVSDSSFSGGLRGFPSGSSPDENLDASKRQLWGSNRRRVIGKARETDSTRGLDNRELLQSQEQIMQKQDEHLEQIREIIQRQRQLGVAINEELDVQDEILKDFNQQVDRSAAKMQHAKKRLGNIL